MSRRRIPPLRRLIASAFLTASLVIPLASPGTAAAADTFTFRGLGYGHALGMSQWGAWAGARAGATYDQILRTYYTGISLDQPVANELLTVKLSSEPWKAVSTITQDFEVVYLNPVGSAFTLVKSAAGVPDTTETIPVGSVVTARRVAAGVSITTPAGTQGPFSQVEARPAAGDRVMVQFKITASSTAIPGRQYWGSMRVKPAPSAGKLNTFNLVLLESYLRSIGEVAYDWAQPGSANYALEAVKAQAVAARSYALTHKDPYLFDNQNDQVYLGYTGRSSLASTPFELLVPGVPRAAEETAGVVARYGGKIISAFFSSNSGGYTTDVSIWGTDPALFPYLVAKSDPWSLNAPPTSPGYPWSLVISAADLSAKVNGMKDIDNRTVQVGTVNSVVVATRDTGSVASHAKTIRITGTSGSATVRAEAFRARFGYSLMKSTLITEITNLAPEQWVSQVVVTGAVPGSTPVGSQPLTPTVFQTSTINATVNVRGGPGTSFPVVTQLGAGVPVTAYAWQHGEAVSGDERWYRIDKPVHRVVTGADRYQTAILVTKRAFPQGADTVVLVKGDNFPDALAAAPLAAAYGAPVVITPSTGLTLAVKAELQRLAPTRVFFVGLPASLLEGVKEALPSLQDEDVIKLVGVDRYATAALVADELVTKIGPVSKIALVPGDKFPDALSVAPLAAKKGWPILLTPQNGPLPGATFDQIQTLGVTSALVVGTNVSVPSPVTADQVKRLVGVDRYDTNVLVAEYAQSQGLSYSHVGVATGENYPDALVTASELVKDGGVQILTRPTAVPSSVRTMLLSNRDKFFLMDFVGLAQAPITAVLQLVR